MLSFQISPDIPKIIESQNALSLSKEEIATVFQENIDKDTTYTLTESDLIHLRKEFTWNNFEELTELKNELHNTNKDIDTKDNILERWEKWFEHIVDWEKFGIELIEGYPTKETIVKDWKKIEKDTLTRWKILLTHKESGKQKILEMGIPEFSRLAKRKPSLNELSKKWRQAQRINEIIINDDIALISASTDNEKGEIKTFELPLNRKVFDALFDSKMYTNSSASLKKNCDLHDETVEMLNSKFTWVHIKTFKKKHLLNEQIQAIVKEEYWMLSWIALWSFKHLSFVFIDYTPK